MNALRFGTAAALASFALAGCSSNDDDLAGYAFASAVRLSESGALQG